MYPNRGYLTAVLYPRLADKERIVCVNEDQTIGSRPGGCIPGDFLVVRGEDFGRAVLLHLSKKPPYDPEVK